METTIYKDIRNHWHAETHVPLKGDMQLRISTWKTDRGLASFASVCRIENGYVTHMITQDYSRRIFMEKVRCTEKAVREQHGRALEMLCDILKEVEHHYATPAAA